MRTTKTMLANRFQDAANLLGWDITGNIWESGKSRIGAITLEHNTVYGWNINQIVNDAGGERRIKESCSAKEMYDWLCGVCHGAREFKNRL